MEIYLTILFGWLAGLLVGIVPGIGIATLLLILYPFLFNLDILQLFVFYIVCITSCQYYGQISGIIYGVPGDITALPAVKYGHPLHLQGKGAELLSATATASLLGSVIAMFFFYLMSKNLEILFLFFDNTVKTMYLTLAVMILIFLSENKMLSLLLAFFGLLIGQIGYNGLISAHIFVKPATILDSGIPFSPMFLGFLIIPTLLYHYKKIEGKTSNMSFFNFTIKKRTQMLFSNNNFTSILRGSMLGSIIGLIPGASYAICSNIAATLEQKFLKNRSAKQRDFATVVSAESANNAGSITVLIPLIFLALPIIPSEAIMFSIAETKGFGYTVSFDFVKEQAMYLLSIIMFINLFNWLFAGYYYTVLGNLYVYLQKIIYPIIITSLIIIFGAIAFHNNQFFLSLTIFVLSFVVGMIIKNESVKIILIFCFFLSDILFAEYYRFYILQF